VEVGLGQDEFSLSLRELLVQSGVSMYQELAGLDVRTDIPPPSFSGTRWLAQNGGFEPGPDLAGNSRPA